MQVLIVGSGAREHCLVDKVSQSPLVSSIYSAPGNGGTAGLSTNLDIKADDIQGLLGFAVKKKIDLTIVGPEAPLAAGIVDMFNQEGLAVFGPTKDLARLESSKVFAKEKMREFGIPTAEFRVFDSPDKAKEHIRSRRAPMVIKADGLAAGKGVVICNTQKEATDTVDSIMIKQEFGIAGKRIIIEDCLQGEEFSLIALADGKNILPLASSQDHKRIFDKDQGPNTGGMGAYSPALSLAPRQFDQVVEIALRPLIEGLQKQGQAYRGVIYAGLMVSGNQIYVLEFNVRFGDPEAQVILPRLKGDLLEIMLKALESKLDQVEITWDSRSCVGVVLASWGYPGKYQKGKQIFGLEEAAKIRDILIYHAGTKKDAERFLTDGGRVLSIVGFGQDIKEAQAKAYQAVTKISFEGVQYRRDIANRAM